MPKLLEFKARASQPFAVRASKDKKTAEIVIYQAIGQDFWGEAISAKQFSEELKKLDAGVETINLRLNSPGGDVFDGLAIYNRLKQHKAKIVVHIDGLAASIASIIALAGDEIIIGEGALYMVHLPWTWAIGNRMEMENTVSRLMDVEEQMIGIYSRKSGLDRNEVRALLEAETWMDADQAIESGFVDSKAEDSLPIAASTLGAPWINKAPKKYKSEKSAIDAEVKKFKESLKATIARK